MHLLALEGRRYRAKKFAREKVAHNAPAMDRIERFYKIDQLLKERRVVPFGALQDALGVSRATLKRDLEYMREPLQRADRVRPRARTATASASRARARATSCRGCGSTPRRSTRSSPCSSCSPSLQPGLLGGARRAAARAPRARSRPRRPFAGTRCESASACCSPGGAPAKAEHFGDRRGGAPEAPAPA